MPTNGDENCSDGPPDVPITEFAKKYVKPNPGRTLVVGSRIYHDKPDLRLGFSDVLGVDMLAGDGVDLVLDLEEELPRDFGQFNHVVCISVLEHSRRPWLLAANIERMLRSGGTLHVSVPAVWRYHPYPKDYWRFLPDGLRELFPQIHWKALKYVSRAGEFDVEKKIPRAKKYGYQQIELCGFGVRK